MVLNQAVCKTAFFQLHDRLPLPPVGSQVWNSTAEAAAGRKEMALLVSPGTTPFPQPSSNQRTRPPTEHGLELESESALLIPAFLFVYNCLNTLGHKALSKLESCFIFISIA